MKKRFSNFLLNLIILLPLCIACKSAKFTPEVLRNGKYDSEFPTRNSSEVLEKLASSVQRFSSIAFYEGYVFAEGEKLTESEILSGAYQNKAAEVISFNNSAAGTATVIYSDNKRLALLSCAHIVDSQLRIDYGITYAVSIEAIQKFLKDHRYVFEDRGYQFYCFFGE